MPDPYDAWEIANRKCNECRDAVYRARDTYQVADRRAWALMNESATAAKAGDAQTSHRLSIAAGPAFEEAAVAWQQYVKAKDEFAAAIQAARDVLPLEAQEELPDWEHKAGLQEGGSSPSRDDDPTRH